MKAAKKKLTKKHFLAKKHGKSTRRKLRNKGLPVTAKMIANT